MADVLKITCCLVSVVAIALAAPADVELPNELMQCKKSDPKLGECVKKILQNSVPHLVKGIPSLGLLPLDPFRLTSLEIDQGTGPVNIKLNFRDLDVTNIGTVKINEIYTDLDNKNITFDVDFEKPLIVDGNYDIKGKVIILPITGDGKSKISLENLRAIVSVYYKSIEKNGNTYAEIQDVVLKFTTSRMHIQLDNLFNGDKVLGNNMNVFLNENWKDILGELQSSFEKALGVVFLEVARPILTRVPVNRVLKD